MQYLIDIGSKKQYDVVLLIVRAPSTDSTCHCAVTQKPDEESAFEILNQISKHSFQATFTYIHRLPQIEISESFEGGNMAIQDHQYRLILPGQGIINNGKTIWTHLTEANKVQITDDDRAQGVTTL